MQAQSFPAIFVSHGAPTLLLEPGKVAAELPALAQRLPTPREILIISAHWLSSVPTVSAASRPETIHDFSGFPRQLYEIRYPAPGAPALAKRVQELLSASGLEARVDDTRGLDHGAWVPLKLMYPEANIPVTQLSLQPRSGPHHHYRIGQALAPLRNEGVLILGSGSFTHNLHEFHGHELDDPAPEWMASFRDWMAAAIVENRWDDLLNYRDRAPNAKRNHPTDEHLLPLYVALGASGENARVERIDAGTTYGILAMDAFVFF